MKLLALGDVVGEKGCAAVRRFLPDFKRKEQIDFCVANGENSAEGNGITPASAEHLLTSGVDIITGGNHSFRRNEVYSYLDESVRVIRPFNCHVSNPGKGVGIIDMGRYSVGIVNLLGRAFMNGGNNPFDAADEALKEIKDCKIKIVDFHAESTGEKRALGYYLDGRVSAFFGTHTHVLTADACILEKGTGYITDLGMCGPCGSVLGVEAEIIIRFLKTGMPARFSASRNEAGIQGCVFEIDDSTGLTKSVKTILSGEI